MLGRKIRADLNSVIRSCMKACGESSGVIEDRLRL